MVTVLKEKGIFAGVNLFSKQDTMDITDMFKIPLFKNFTLKMREEFLDKLEYTVEEHPKGKTIIHQGTTCNALHVLLKGKLNVDVLDVSGNIVRVETIQAPRTFATPHIFSEKNQFPATFTVDEDVVLTRLKVLPFRGIRNRFIYYLFEHQQKDSNVVELEHTQEQLAEYFGVTRPALSKEIGRLVDEGFISITRRKVTILNKTALTCML